MLAQGPTKAREVGRLVHVERRRKVAHAKSGQARSASRLRSHRAGAPGHLAEETRLGAAQRQGRIASVHGRQQDRLVLLQRREVEVLERKERRIAPRDEGTGATGSKEIGEDLLEARAEVASLLESHAPPGGHVSGDGGVGGSLVARRERRDEEVAFVHGDGCESGGRVGEHGGLQGDETIGRDDAREPRLAFPGARHPAHHSQRGANPHGR